MLFREVEEKIKDHSSQLEQIAKIVVLAENEVGTTKIQNALDLGGRVDVYINNVAYIDKTLKIGDNTELNIKSGVLREKSGTRNYMLINKDMLNGNKNIKISGIFDLDGSNNLATGGYPNLFPGHCIFLNNVSNLKIDDVKVTNANKYAILVVNCTNSEFKNIEFNTFSDGIHFQPPVKNIKLENIRGTTGDDMIAFTLGDYTNFTVSSTGNFEDVDIRNVYPQNAKSIFKFTGSGSENRYVFKNFVIENVFGSCEKKIVDVQDDQYDGNPFLINTVIDNFIFKNFKVDCLKENNEFGIRLNAFDGNVILDNIDVIQKKGDFIAVQQGYKLNSLKINGLRNSYKDSTANNRLIRIAGTVNALNVSNVNMELGNSVALFSISGNISDFNINNVNLKGGYMIRTVENSIIPTINLTNIKVSSLNMFIEFRTNATVVLNNCNISSDCSTVFATLGAFVTRITGNNIINNHSNPIYTNNGGLTSVDCKSFKIPALSKLTPLEGDIVNTIGTTSAVKGIVIWSGTEWKRLY